MLKSIFKKLLFAGILGWCSFNFSDPRLFRLLKEVAVNENTGTEAKVQIFKFLRKMVREGGFQDLSDSDDRLLSQLQHLEVQGVDEDEYLKEFEEDCGLCFADKRDTAVCRKCRYLACADCAAREELETCPQCRAPRSDLVVYKTLLRSLLKPNFDDSTIADVRNLLAHEDREVVEEIINQPFEEAALGRDPAFEFNVAPIGADPILERHIPNNSETPLHLLARKNIGVWRDLTNILLENGADINARNIDGYTPLMVAITEAADGIQRDRPLFFLKNEIVREKINLDSIEAALAILDVERHRLSNAFNIERELMRLKHIKETN